MELPNTIQAILFYQAEPLRIDRLATLLKHSEEDVLAAIKILEERLLSSGLRLLINGDEVTLGTSPDASEVIEAITKEELSKDLSKAALETLAIVLYKGPITRAEIDYIRGVNSTFTLRNMLIRGLVEKVDNPEDSRSFLYKPTFQLLEYMGVTKPEDLPEYEQSVATLEGFSSTKEEEVKAEKVDEEASHEAESEDTPLDLPSEDAYAVIESDINEEDIAGGNFSDDALTQHEQEDEDRL